MQIILVMTTEPRVAPALWVELKMVVAQKRFQVVPKHRWHHHWSAEEADSPAACETPGAGGGGDENAADGGSANNVSPEQDYKISQQEAGHMMSIGQVIGHLKTIMRTEVFPKIKFFKKGLLEDENLLHHIVHKKVAAYVKNAGGDFEDLYPELRKAASHAIRSKRSTVVGGIQDVLMSKCCS